MKKAIAVLSAGIQRNKQGQWESTDLVEDDQYRSAPGGKLRIWASFYLYQKQRQKIITTGGVGSEQSIKNIPHPNISLILKQELIQLGVLAEDIIEEDNSEATYSQLQELIKLANKFHINKLKIISNNYHLPRIKAFLKYNNLQKRLTTGKIKLVSAEKICLKYNRKRWIEEIQEAYSSKIMKERIKLEKRGVQDIKKGTYKY